MRDIALERGAVGRGRTATVHSCGAGRVVKLFGDGWSRQLAEAEARAGALAFRSGAGAPRVDALVQVDGRLGIVYERIDGQSMLATLTREPWMLPRLARRFASLHASLHRRAAPGLTRYRAALEHQIRGAPGLEAPLRERALAALAAAPEGDRLCHGDFHPDNVVLTARGAVVIDWLNAGAGHPLADVARSHYLLTLAALPPGTPLGQRLLLETLRRAFSALYLRHYAAFAGYSRGQLHRGLAQWGVVIAAARLSEGVTQEAARLRRLVRGAPATPAAVGGASSG
ncbi:MAG TPA: phosphotransferase [Chloroflexota bacterium]|nr:phosphotransferase [Chloroflexota bacterium]